MSRCWKSVLGYFGQLFISGQRAVKIVKPDHNDQLSWIYTYYIYDATGNVMATYTRRNYFDDIGDSSYAFVNDWIYNELGLTDLQDFMESKFNYNGQFMNDWIEYLSTNELAAGVFDEFSPDDFLGWDATLVPAVLSNFAHSPNASPTENDALLNAILSNQQSNFVSSVLNSGTAVLNNALTGILSNDPTDLLLNCMATNNPVGLNSVYVSLGGSPTPPPTNASRIAYIRSFPPPTIAAQISAIESISNLQNYFSSCLNTSMIYNSWNSAQPNISFIDLFDAWSGLGDTSLILDVLQNHYSNDAHLRILLKEVRTLQQLYQMASSSNYSTFVNQSINSTSYVDLSFVMYQSSALTFSSYLKMVRTHFGSTTYSSMMSDIGELLKFGKDITWQEQHIYGSSRLGMYQSGQLLVKYKYKYSDTLQIYLDSVKFDRNTARAMRRMSQKQYELTNHLGNVLSTVLDRKTPITATGGSSSSTAITHYEGDVVFATDYYPFGSPMSWSTPDSSSGRMYSGSGYTFGFNGQEKDDELGAGVTTAEFWMYDGKLGRRWNVDPKPNVSISVFACFANNPILFNDVLGDTIFLPSWAKSQFETIFHPAISILKKIPEAKQILYLYSKSKNTNIYLMMHDAEGMPQPAAYAITLFVKKNFIDVDRKLNKDRYYKNYQDPDIRGIVRFANAHFSFNTKVDNFLVSLSSTNDLYLELDQYDRAFIIFHEIFAHVKINTGNERIDHEQFGNSSFIKGMRLYDNNGIAIVTPGSQAWNVFKKILKQKIEDGNADQTNKNDYKEMVEMDIQK